MQTATATSVLVVDDEPQVVWMLRFSLEAEGYRTLEARDGRAALEEIRQRRPDLVLLDAPSYLHLAYRPGVPLVAGVWQSGRPVVGGLV